MMYRPFAPGRPGTSPQIRRGDKKKPATKKARPRKPAWDVSVSDFQNTFKTKVKKRCIS